MVLLTVCAACRTNEHERCEHGRTVPGMIGGWACRCERDGHPERYEHKDTPESFWERMERLGHKRPEGLR